MVDVDMQYHVLVIFNELYNDALEVTITTTIKHMNAETKHIYRLMSENAYIYIATIIVLSVIVYAWFARAFHRFCLHLFYTYMYINIYIDRRIIVWVGLMKPLKQRSLAEIWL